MANPWYCPGFVDRRNVFYAYNPPYTKYVPPRDWYSVPTQCHGRNGPTEPKLVSYYNNPNWYSGPPRDCQQKRWQPYPYKCQNGRPSISTPQPSFQQKQRPKKGKSTNQQKYQNPQAHPKSSTGSSVDISQYYSRSMMEDPWAELIDAAREKKPSE